MIPRGVSSLRIAFAGTPDFALRALLALLDSHHHVVGVLTRPDRPRGRGRQLAGSPVKTLAMERGLPLSQPATLTGADDRADLAAWAPDVLVVAAYGLILPSAVLELPSLGCLNIHASLLPRWRGAAPIQRALLAGDAETGISIMRMDAGLDTGPILLQRAIAISAAETGGTLHDRLATLGASALLEALEAVAAGAADAMPQRGQGATYAAKIDKAEARIDWRRDALGIERQVRAFNPWPIAETSLEGAQLRIFSARALGIDACGGAPSVDPAAVVAGAGGEPGTIIDVQDEALYVACGRGVLAIAEVQRPGRRPVSARDFAHTLALKGRRLA